MVVLKTKDEINLIRESSSLLVRTHCEVAKFIKPGVNSLFLDKIAEEFIRDNGAFPAFKGYNNFPNTLCVSPDEQVVHGIPNNEEINEGVLLSIDCGVYKNGYFSDCAFTYEVGNVSPEKKNLVDVTRKCLDLGINEAVIGNFLGDIGNAIQTYAEFYEFGVVRELVGHGIGKKLQFNDVEVRNNPSGAPKFVIKGVSLKNLKKIFKNKKFKIHLSLSDDKPWAVASVIIFTYK